MHNYIKIKIAFAIIILIIVALAFVGVSAKGHQDNVLSKSDSLFLRKGESELKEMRVIANGKKVNKRNLSGHR